MAIDENAQIVQLLKDFQDNGRRVAGLEHALRKRAEAIKRLGSLVGSDASTVSPVQGGFSVPNEASWNPVVGNGSEVIALETVSIEALHEELRAFTAAQDEADKLKSCLRTAGFTDLVNRLGSTDAKDRSR